MALKLAAAFIMSLAVTSAVGVMLIPALRRMNAGQTIRSDGPVWHSKKQGTPLMGGLMFIAGTALAFLAVGYNDLRSGGFTQILVLIFSVLYALIGFFDDFKKAMHKQNMGLSALQKFIFQLIAACVFVILMKLSGILSTDLYIPFINVTVHVPEPVYYVFAAFVIVGTVNAVNITDGIDGLASGVSIPICVSFAAIAAAYGFAAQGVFASALAGGLVAFLFFNFHPAKIFMGDTGSLFLGGAICAMAFALDIPLILVPIGVVFLIETLSDIIQVTYFKLTHGKRVFKMAPLHHHFEMCGWSEYKLFAVYTAVSAAFAVISFFGANIRS